MIRFTQNEIEHPLSDAVPRGIRKEVARITGLYESVVYGYFNADDERKSPAFCLLLIQAALDHAAPEVGEAHWQHIVRFRELSKPVESQSLCVKAELSGSLKEDNDLITAHVNGKSLYDQLKECDESLNQKRRLRSAILEAINTEKNQFNAGKTRINGSQIREFAHNAVKKRGQK